MSKKNKLKLSNKPVEYMPMDSTISTSSAKNSDSGSELSPQESISVQSSSEFQKAINESKQNIASHDAEKSKKRGRKPSPRDAQGNIIRDNTIPGASPLAGQAPVVLNQQSVEETKALLEGLLLPVAEGAAVKYALDNSLAAFPPEQKSLWAKATAEELETWFPGLSTKYMRLGTVLGLPVMWFLNAKNLREAGLQAIKNEELKKSKVSNTGNLPVAEI